MSSSPTRSPLEPTTEDKLNHSLSEPETPASASSPSSPERRISKSFEEVNGQKPYVDFAAFDETSDGSQTDGRDGRPFLSAEQARMPSRSPGQGPRPTTWKMWMKATWKRNKGLSYVMIAQFFGACMNVMTRSLEMDGSHGKAMHPFQILFTRFGITMILTYAYLFFARVPDAPLGMREVRGLLLARGVGGFFGVFGMYYSLLYLPLAEATVITFLAPIGACYVCSKFANEPFTRLEIIAGCVSLLGVVFIAQPVSIISFGSSTPTATGPGDAAATVPSASTTAAHSLNTTVPSNALTTNDPTLHVTAAHRILAVGISLIGVCGATVALTTIRMIGQRAHPLISVSYFGTLSSIVSVLALAVIPSISFRFPSNVIEWSLLIALGSTGFIMQFLLTAGLAYEKGSRATNMVYTQMLFAVAADRIIWGTRMGWGSLAGCGAILGSALVVAVAEGDSSHKSGEGAEEGGRKQVTDEERGRLLLDEDDLDENEVDGFEDVEMQDQRPMEEPTRAPRSPLRRPLWSKDEGPLRTIQEVQLRTMRH